MSQEVRIAVHDRLFTDGSGLVRYDDLLRLELLANIHTRLLSVIACGFPTVALERGASSFATALHIRERYAKFPNCLEILIMYRRLEALVIIDELIQIFQKAIQVSKYPSLFASQERTTRCV